MNNLTEENLIGEENYGKIFKIMFKDNEEEFAAKFFKPSI